MKNRFVTITLTLIMLLVLAVPAQVFAADQNLPFNQSNVFNTQISKIYSQLPQSAVNQLTDALKQCQNGRIDSAQLQSLMNQFYLKVPAAENAACPVPANAETTAPVKETTMTPANPAATPAKPAVPVREQTPAPVKQPAAPAAPVKQPATPAAPVKQPATPAAPAAPVKQPAAPANSASSFGAYEQQVADLVNKERAAAGLPALKVNTKLSGVAEKKAEDMRDKNYFSHTSPTYGSPFDMMRQFGVSYKTAGENIAKGQRSPAAVMDGWMNSPGHRANILNSSYTEIGVGYVTDSNGNTYWVQMFIKP